MKFVSDHLPRKLDGWRSPRLGIDMPIVTYGTRGRPVLLFPTAAADYLENERFFLVKAVEDEILSGRIRLFSIDSINQHAWMDRSLPVREQARRQALYSGYVEEEVVPYIRMAMGNPSARITTTGASFGAFHAANSFFRRPDLFDTLIGMSGFYDLGPSYLKGYSDENCFFNNPAWFVPGLNNGPLDTLRYHSRIILATGQGAFEAPHASRNFSEVLSRKQIPHRLDVWGFDVNHDWPWWRKMLPHFIDQLGF